MSFQYTVTLSDPTNALTAAEADGAMANLRAAMEIFSRHVNGLGTIDVVLSVDTSGREVGSGRSSVAVDKETLADGRKVIWEGAVYELRTGSDPNGGGYDVEVTMPPAYLRNSLWLDPNPVVRDTPVGAGKFDAVSFFLHELGHAFGFNGRGDPATGQVSGQFLSTYDMLVETQNGVPVFVGPATMEAFGGPLPLSTNIVNNYLHYGRTSADGLDQSLMEGAAYAPTGLRWYLDQLDLAVLRDIGLDAVASPIADPGGSRFNGFGGGDTLHGGAGRDTLIGGEGKDYLRGAEGDDSLSGGAEFDDLHGNQGNDTVDGGAGSDWVVGGQGNDLLMGGDDASDDVVYGNLGNDTCYGGDGIDWVRGGQGDDSLSAGGGDDLIWGDRGDDTISGGAGADTFGIFGGAGIDRILDFNAAEGDRIRLDPGHTYTAAQVGADTVVTVSGGGAQAILVGVQLSALPEGWIV